MADKDILKRVGGYSGDEEGSYVFFDSRNSDDYRPNSVGSSEGASKAASVLNQLQQDASVIKESMGIWRGVTPGYGSNTYGQQAIQGLMDLQNMQNGSDLIVYDTEIIGTTPFHRKGKANLDFYSPTEIGFQHVKMINGKLQPQGNSLSMLLKPNEDVYKRLNGILNDLNNGHQVGMTADMRRTLSDLTLYAGDPGRLFTVNNKDGRRIVSVNEQARELHPLKGSVLTSSQNITMMRQGLDNLMKWGTAPEHAVTEMNSFMKNMQNVKFAGYNVYNFDQPMMMDWLNNEVGKGNPGSVANRELQRLKSTMALNQVDGLHAVRALYRNTFSRYGNDVTLETMKKVFRMEGGQAHHALSDVNVTVEQLNRLIGSPGVKRTLATGGKPGNTFGRFNSQNLQVGDRLFGVAGLSSDKAGEYDGVFRMKNNQLEPAYNMKVNPIYRNTTYKVEKFLNNVDIDGSKMFGVQLYNEMDDLHHTIFRNSLEDLQNVIHGHLEYIDKRKSKHLTAHELQNKDRAARRWNKMFSTENGGGVGLANRMYQALDIWREGEAQGLQASTIKSNILNAHEYNTDEFVRDFESMKPRLEGEEKWVRGFLDRLGDSAIKGTERNYVGAQNAALAEFGKLMNNEFGENKVSRRIANNGSAIEINIDGESKYLNLNSADSIRSSFYGNLYSGHTERPNHSVLKRRFRELLMQLKSYNALSAKEFEQYYNNMDNMTPGASIDNMLGELANRVAEARETNSLNGAIKHIPVEDATKVVGGQSGRAGKLRDEKVFASKFEELASQAIGGTQPLLNRWGANGGNDRLTVGGKALEVLDSHDRAIQQILDRNGIGKNSGVGISRVADSRSQLTKLAEAFSSNDMHVQYRYDGKRNGLQMVLADKSVSESVLDGSIADIRKNNKTAVIDLPRINSDGTVTMGSQNRVSRLVHRKRHNGGGYELQTAFDEIIGTLAGNAKVVREMLDKQAGSSGKAFMIDAERHLQRRANKAMQNLSMNNRFSAINETREANNRFDVTSQAANWIRSGTHDVSAYAEDWYDGFYARTSDDKRKQWRLKSPEAIREMMDNKGGQFVNHIGMTAERFFQREVDSFVSQQTNGRINLGMHSVKDTHVGNYLRANTDARSLLAFGNLNPMGRENIMKTVNYLALDKDRVTNNLSGKFSPTEIDRMLTRGVVTDKAVEVLEDFDKTGSNKVSFINMRAAYLDDQQLQGRAQELLGKYQQVIKSTENAEVKAQYEGYVKRLQNMENISVYDGMMLMSDDAARAFETTREKKVRLGDGEQLTEAIKDLIRQNVDGDADFSQNITFKGAMPLLTDSTATADEWKKEKKITISEIVKEDLLKDAQGGIVFGEDGAPIVDPNPKRTRGSVYDKWYTGTTRIKGWDAAEGALILEETAFSANTTKMITDSGGRNTATMLPQQIINDLAHAQDGERVHAIMPAFETSKGMWGTEVSKMVSLAVDEANAQIDSGGKLTVGKMTKAEALDTIKGIMAETFDIDPTKIKIRDDNSLELSHLVGSGDGTGQFSVDRMNQFAQRIDEKLGLGFSQRDTIYGNVGVGKQNVYDWEDGVGLTPGHSGGLVKYGRKEIDMISTRANSLLGGKSAVAGWLQDHIREVSKVQNQDTARINQGLIRTVAEQGDYTPGEGDVVIRTSGTAFDIDDPAGHRKGRIAANGAYEISMNAFNPLPKITAKDTKLVADDYAGTIVDFGRTQGDFGNGVTFSRAIERNGGTAVLELPKDQGFDRSYLRLVDFGDVTKDGTAVTPVIRELQQKQVQIWRNLQDYNQAGMNGEEVNVDDMNKLRGRINTAVSEYEDKAAALISNSRDGGLMKTFGSARMDMSGRFRIQGVNPFANYEKVGDEWRQRADATYKEGTMYVSKARLGEMIEGAEDNIAKVMNLNVEGKNANQIRELVLDNVNSKGLYGFVNRYPTIKQSTLQAMRFEIDETMEADDRGGRLTVGTAQRLKADYDGDFMSGVLAHYGTDKAEVIHKELSKLAGLEAADSAQVGAETLADLESDLSSPAKTMNLTVGKLAQELNEIAQIDPNDRSKAQRKLFDEVGSIGSKLNRADAIETAEARLGKGFVGIIDNTRDKVLSVATATLETLEAGRRLEPGSSKAKGIRDGIENFTAKFSQDLISSKKFKFSDEYNTQLQAAGEGNEALAFQRAEEVITQRHLDLSNMNNYLMDLTDDNRANFVAANEKIRLYDIDDAAEMKQMNSALDMIQEVRQLTSSVGGFNNAGTPVGISEGRGGEYMSQLLNGQMGPLVPTDTIETLRDAAGRKSSVGQMLDSSMQNWRLSVLQNHDNMENTATSLIDSLGSRSYDAADHVLNGATLADDAGVKLRETVGKFTPKLNMGGVGGGAVAFGAMWAASALIRSGPTPEGLQEQTAPQAPVAPETMQTPTARVTQNNGEFVNIRVSAKNAQNMSEEEVAALVHQEIGAMSSMKLDTNLNIQDNTQDINQEWLQGVVTNAIDKGFGF